MSHNPYPIPTRFLDATAKAAASLVKGPIATFLTTWAGASGAALLGRTGAGKSLCVAQACARVCKRENSTTWIKWIRADELAHLLTGRQGWDAIELLKLARILVIDDMGYERWHETLLEVIGHRYDHNRPTVITTGMTQSAFADRYGDATLRRIAETGNGLIVDCWPKKVAAAR